MYPEMDSIAMTGASSGNLDAVLSALDTVGMTGTVKLATLDEIGRASCRERVLFRV